MTALPQHLLDIVPNAVHVHSRANLPEHDCQGEQTLKEIVASAKVLGMSEVYLAEHTSNPGVGKPHFFDIEDPLGQALLSRMDEVQSFAETAGFNVYPGLEANLMPGSNGMIDAPSALDHEAALIIASMHGHVPQSGNEIKRLLMEALLLGYEIDMLGHLQRYVNVYDVDWSTIFYAAADPDRPTIIEANFNAWFSYGPVKLRRKAAAEVQAGNTDKAEQLQMEAIDAEKKEVFFLQALGRCAAPVVVSLDIHNAGMWPTDSPKADWMPTFDHFEEYLDLLFGCGIAPERIINNRLRDWLLLPKSDRGKLMSWL